MYYSSSHFNQQQQAGISRLFVTSRSQLSCPVARAACSSLHPHLLCMSTSSLHTPERNFESYTMVAPRHLIGACSPSSHINWTPSPRMNHSSVLPCNTISISFTHISCEFQLIAKVVVRHCPSSLKHDMYHFFSIVCPWQLFNSSWCQGRHHFQVFCLLEGKIKLIRSEITQEAEKLPRKLHMLMHRCMLLFFRLFSCKTSRLFLTIRYNNIAPGRE